MRLLLMLLGVFLSNCTTSKLVNYDNTNPVKIEESTKGLMVHEVLPQAQSLNGTIAVKSIELEVTDNLDAGVAYMIEDNLITNLLDNDYRVVERDPDILNNLYLESSENYTMHSSEMPQSYQSTLKASDYILSYRVLECGVLYNEYESGTNVNLSPTDFNVVERSARTKLHVRLTNSKTSEIITASTVESEVLDVVSRDDIPSLSQMSYEYYHHTLPNQGLLMSESSYTSDLNPENVARVINSDNSFPEKGRRNPTPIFIGMGIFVFMNLLGD